MSGSVGEVFEKPIGPVVLNDKGKWWSNRELLGLDEDGCVRMLFADGEHVAELYGTPEQLLRAAGAIEAHVASAILNAEGERS